MKFRFSILCPAWFLAAAAGATMTAAQPSTQDLATARQQYSEAREAVDKGNWTEYRKLRPGLQDYPLAIYLDYFQLIGQPEKVRPADALRFISDTTGSPLPNRFAYRYLAKAGQERRWKDFLLVQPEEPSSVELQCYYFRAKLAEGETDSAWAGAERLWDYGQSRPKVCDPLFTAWLKAGQLGDEVVWSRQLKAFDARQQSLMSYVARQASPELAPWANKLQSVYL